MSEEEYYEDILKEADKSDKYDENDYDSQWGTEPPPPPPPPEDIKPQEPYQEPYQQEYYGEGYYHDYQYGEDRREEGPPWFWIGVLIAVGLSAIVMVIFHFVAPITCIR